MADHTPITIAHIKRVDALLGRFIQALVERAVTHDSSKFTEVESGPLNELQALIERDGHVAFGTPEYKQRGEVLNRTMLPHHYQHNRHHPEHFANGVAGMNLVDLVEMFMDWRAACERGGDDAMNLSYVVQKYGIPPMLESILRNTADAFQFPHK